MKDTALNKSATFFDNELTIKHFFERNNGPAFLFVVSDSFHVRKQVNESVIEYCKEKTKTVGIVSLIQNSPQGFLTQLRQAKAACPGGLILDNLDSLISATEGAFASDFNQMREGLIGLGIPLLMWLSKQSHDIVIHKAIDLYLRRDLSTLFFEDLGKANNPGSIERFSDATKESVNFEEIRTRIALLEQQLAEGRADDFSKSRLANEVVLPLIKAYVDNAMLYQAKYLLAEFDTYFDYNKTDADTIIAKLFEETGDLDQAIAHYEKALNKNIKLYGEESSNVSTNYDDLGTAWRSTGNLNKAIVFFEKAVNIDLKLFGEENHKVAIHYDNLGEAWKDKGDLNKAIEYLEKSLAIDIKLSGEESPNAAIRYNNLGMAWQDIGNLDKAVEYLEKALQIDLKLSGEESPNVAIRYNNLGIVWQNKGNLDKGIEYLEKALKIDFKLYGEESPRIAIDDNNLGAAWKRKGNLDKAIEYFEKSLKINLNLSGEESPKIAIGYNNLGIAWQNKGNLDKGIEYLEKALKIDLKLFGEENPNVAIDYNNLGMAWQYKGDLVKPIEYFEKAYYMLSKLYGQDNPYTKRAKQNYDAGLKKKSSV